MFTINKHIARVGVVLAVAAMVGCSSTPTYPPAPAQTGNVDWNYLVGPGDSVQVFVWRNPEVSGKEKRTSRLVAKRLKALGWTVRERVGGYGIVASLRGALPGDRTVAFRADMDAVRSQDPDPMDYRSETPGVRHICGHDVHTTIAIALGRGQ